MFSVCFNRVYTMYVANIGFYGILYFNIPLPFGIAVFAAVSYCVWIEPLQNQGMDMCGIPNSAATITEVEVLV